MRRLPSQRVVVGRMTGVVDSDDEPRATRQRGRGRGGIDVAGIGFDVGEPDGGAEQQRRARGRDESQRRRDDLVARAETRRGIERVQRSRAVADGDGVARAAARRERSLESFDRGAGREPVAAQDRDDSLDILVVDELRAIGQIRRRTAGISHRPTP